MRLNSLSGCDVTYIVSGRNYDILTSIIAQLLTSRPFGDFQEPAMITGSNMHHVTERVVIDRPITRKRGSVYLGLNQFESVMRPSPHTICRPICSSLFPYKGCKIP